MKNSSSPTVSIIMPCYNAARFISKAIESIRSQTFQDWELLITDDCSTDNSYAILKDWVKTDSRIKLFKNEDNSGAAVARNKSLDNAQGRYIAFLDSDDIWLPEKLEVQLDFMKREKAPFSFTAYDTITEEEVFINRINVPQYLTYSDYLKDTIIGCLTVIIDRQSVGDFRMPLLKKRQDMATWLSILKKGYIAYGLNESLSRYRIVKGSLSHNKVKATKMVWRVYREIEHLSFLKSLYYFCHYAYNAVAKRIK